jgi:hypothetical protein
VIINSVAFGNTILVMTVSKTKPIVNLNPPVAQIIAEIDEFLNELTQTPLSRWFE